MSNIVQGYARVCIASTCMQERNNEPSCLIPSAGHGTAPVCSDEDEPLTAVHRFLTSTQPTEIRSAQDWKAAVLGIGRTAETPGQVHVLVTAGTRQPGYCLQGARKAAVSKDPLKTWIPWCNTSCAEIRNS